MKLPLRYIQTRGNLGRLVDADGAVVAERVPFAEAEIILSAMPHVVLPAGSTLAPPIDAPLPVCTVYPDGEHRFKRGGEEGLDYQCACGMHCPHQWPEDLREEGGAHHCLLCGADGLS